MSRAAGDKLFIALLSNSLPPPRPVSLLRARRTSEIFLLWHFACCMLLEWRARRDPVATFKLILDLGGAALAKSERAALADGLAEELAEPEPPQTTAILGAAGRWFCRLRLPRDEDELLGGQPLLLRLDGR